LVEKGKWFWHIKDLAQIKTILARFFLVVGRQEKIVDDYLVKIQQDISVKKQNVDNTFNFFIGAFFSSFCRYSLLFIFLSLGIFFVFLIIT
jgi:hypothetical protein